MNHSCPNLALQCSESRTRLPPLAHLRPHHKYNPEAEAGDEREQHQHVSIVIVRPKAKQLHKRRSTSAPTDALPKMSYSPSA